MSKWVLEIPFVAGEDKKKGLLRINNLMRDSAKAQGFESVPVKPKRPASQLWQQLESTGTNQRVTMEVIQPGQRVNLARARRTFTPEFAETVANYEFATGDDELDAVFQRIMPELSEADLERMSNATSARARAFDASIDSLVGADTKLRNRHISASDKFLKSYIIGHAPARAGATLTENRKRELQDIVKASLGNLGVMDDDMSELLRHRIQSRPILMNDQVEIEFRAMIHAYHEVRKHNAPYIQAMMGGMDGAKDPEGLIAALLPSPDDIMRGAIAHIIIDLNAVPNAAQAPGRLREFVDNFAKKLFNLEEPVSFIAATDKQKSVGRLLAFHGGRKQMVFAVEKAVNKAQLRGADFIRAFRTHQPEDTDEDSVRQIVLPEYEANGKYIALKEKNMVGDDAFFGGKGNSLFAQGERDEDDQKQFITDMFKAMQNVGLVYPITQFRQARDAADELGFVILPIELPRFTRRPVGWDRRWMVATMRVIDEYWDFIYSGDGILLSNLLYLIVARAEEVFQYTMDATEITQLAILLAKDSSQYTSPDLELIKSNMTVAQIKDELIGTHGVVPRRAALKPELALLLFRERKKAQDAAAALPVQDEDEDEDEDEEGARRRARRRGILPTPSKQKEMYRPLKTLSQLVTGKLTQARTAVQQADQSERISGLENEISVLRTERDELAREAEFWENEANAGAEEEQLLEEHHDEMHEGLPPHTHGDNDFTVEHVTIIAAADEMTSEEAIDWINQNLDVLDTLNEKVSEANADPKMIRTAKEEIQTIKDQIENGLEVSRDPLSATISVLEGQIDMAEMREFEKELVIASKSTRVARRRARRKHGFKIGTIYTEASVPRSKNTAKHIKTAMGQLYADLYKTAKNDFKGADTVENIGIEMINIGDDIFHLVAKADVMSDTKPNPPYDMKEYRQTARQVNRQQVLRALEPFDDKLKLEQQRYPESSIYSVEIPPSHPQYNMMVNLLTKNGLLANKREFLIVGKTWYADKGGFPSRIESIDENMLTHSSNLGLEGMQRGESTIQIGTYMSGYSPGDWENLKDSATHWASKEFASEYKAKRLELELTYHGYKGPLRLTISGVAMSNPPDTCCIICGSCDDPCDCEDNPPKGTFKEKETRTKVKKILRKEGGAAGLEPLRAAFPKGTTKKAIKRFIDESIEAVYQHEDGDYILESKKKRKYKGHLISKVSTGWMVEAYDQSFKTLKQARDFISKKVAGSATPNQQCVRILKGSNRCKGMVVFIRSKKYKCDGCGAEYREA